MGCVQIRPAACYKQDGGSIIKRTVNVQSLQKLSMDMQADVRFGSAKKSNVNPLFLIEEAPKQARDEENDEKKAKPKQNVSGHSSVAPAKRPDKYMLRSHNLSKLSTLPRSSEGEQVAAGWPPWLSTIAGEALVGWIPRRADSFEKLSKIGQGTYSNVYKARDLDSGKIVALKKVKFDNLEPESVRFMLREIKTLRRLDHPNIVKLEGLVTSRMSCSLYLVFEYMDYDLASLASCPEITFTEAQVKCYLKQLLLGLEHCHNSHVLHRDIKGSNLLLDENGNLKIADFGLATFFNPYQNQALTNKVVTLWYRSPELLLGATIYGVAIDLWSTGCILAELLAGKPIMPGRTEVEQLHKIFKLCGSPSKEYWKTSNFPHCTIFQSQKPYKRCLSDIFQNFSNSALALLETLLSIEPAKRGTASQALQSDFFKTEPFACDPKSLPKYQQSKEHDIRLQHEATWWQAAIKAKMGDFRSGLLDQRQDTTKQNKLQGSFQVKATSRTLSKSKSAKCGMADAGIATKVLNSPHAAFLPDSPEMFFSINEHVVGPNHCRHPSTMRGKVDVNMEKENSKRRCTDGPTSPAS